MPNIQSVQTNFTAGELSPRLNGRIDIARYNNAVKEMVNCHPLVHGGCIDSDGTLFVKAAKFPDKDAVLVPFIFNRSQAYVLEFGDFYMRVYTNGGNVESAPGVAYEIVTPYSAAIIREMDFEQSADTVFMMHETIPTQRLRRYSSTNWEMINTPFVIQPFDELGDKPNVNLTLSNATVGAGRTATLSGAGYFLASDVGREINYVNGVAKITAVANANNATVTISTAFSGAAVAAGLWTLGLSPQATCTPSIKDPVGSAVTLTLNLAGWRATDVGKFVRINGGVVEIISQDGANPTTIVNGIIRIVLTSVVASQALAWSLESSIWGGTNGYPRTGTFFEQRLVLAGSPGYPDSAVASKTGEYLNFLLGTNDDDGFLFRIAESRDQIYHLCKVRKLMALSPGGEFLISGGLEKPVTPTSIQISGQSEVGCNSVKPLRVGNELYFVNGAGNMLISTSYQINVDGFDATVASKTAEHIAAIGIRQMTYNRTPDSIVWMVLNDGQMASMTIDKAESVNGWARRNTQGTFESAVTIPVAGGDQTWLITKRVISGNTVRYIEVMNSSVKMDCAIQGNVAMPGAKVWTGLGHLEGKEVVVLADGLSAGKYTVAGGQITLPDNALSVQIGLSRIPRITLLPPVVQGQTGTNQGKQMRTARMVMRFLNTIGCRVNGKEQIPFRRFGDELLDQPLEPFTGDKEVSLLGWETNGKEVVIEQPDPLPFHLLSVFRDVTVND